MLNRTLRFILAPFFFYPSAATALAAHLLMVALLAKRNAPR
jgi:hypothetical protein